MKKQTMIEFSGGGASCNPAPVRFFLKFTLLGQFMSFLGDLFSLNSSPARYRFENKSPKNSCAKARIISWIACLPRWRVNEHPPFFDTQSKNGVLEAGCPVGTHTLAMTQRNTSKVKRCNNNVMNSSPLTVHHSLINETAFSPFTSHFSLPQTPAFTLAEVLITLGIIGIVAAMTLPSLIARHRSKVLEAQFHKRYNEVQQALLMIKKEEIPIYGNLYGRTLQPYLTAQFKGAKGVYFPFWNNPEQQKRLFGFELPVYKTFDKSQQFDSGAMDDGCVIVSKEFFIFMNSDSNSTTYIQIILDINGLQGPNIVGYDVFVFELDKNDSLKPRPNTRKDLCASTSAGGNQNGSYCSFYAVTDRDYFKNLNW